MSVIRQYLDDSRQVLGRVPSDAVERVAAVLRAAHEQRRQLFIVGNGGSGATASHFAQDLGKGTVHPSAPSERRFRVISLTDNAPYLLALSNDLGYETIFVQQLMNLAQPGDVLIAFSGSGNSRNVVEAVKYADRVGMVTVGVTGFNGGQLRGLVEHSVHVACDVMEQVEDAHLAICHALVKHFQGLFGTPSLYCTMPAQQRPSHRHRRLAVASAGLQ